MKIDLHVHSSERSWCGKSSEAEQLDAAVSYGLDGIVLTDHYLLAPPEHVAKLNKKYAPLRIFSGIEITMWVDGHHEDVIIIGSGDRKLESRDWDYSKLYQFARDNNCFVMLCHPFRHTEYISIDVENYPPDAMEVHSINIGLDREELIQDYLKTHPVVKAINNSDAHNAHHVGMYYADVDGKPKNERELAELLLKGKFTMGCDEKRVAERLINRK